MYTVCRLRCFVVVEIQSAKQDNMSGTVYAVKLGRIMGDTKKGTNANSHPVILLVVHLQCADYMRPGEHIHPYSGYLDLSSTQALVFGESSVVSICA